MSMTMAFGGWNALPRANSYEDAFDEGERIEVAMAQQRRRGVGSIVAEIPCQTSYLVISGILLSDDCNITFCAEGPE